MQAGRLALLLCQALLRRGEDAEAALASAVARIAASSTLGPQLPTLLSGCFSALFPAHEWGGGGGDSGETAAPVLLLGRLSSALPAGAFLALQQQLMGRGLLQQLEIPCTFEPPAAVPGGVADGSGVDSEDEYLQQEQRWVRMHE